MPSGIHCPLSQTRRAGPNSSNPRSHVYEATVPLSSASSENITLLCAGEPGKLHDCAAWEMERDKKKMLLLRFILLFRRSVCYTKESNGNQISEMMNAIAMTK